MNDLTKLSDAELKVELGRLVNEAATFHDIQIENGVADERIRETLLVHLCMQTIRKPEPRQTQRISHKLALWFQSQGENCLRRAFLQLLQYTTAHFNDRFDALYQRIAAVVDFGSKLSGESRTSFDISVLEPFFSILAVNESTSDSKSHQLAYEFAVFLSDLCFGTDKNAPHFERPKLEEDELVRELFEDVKSGVDSGSEGPMDNSENTISEEELQLLILHERPNSVKDFLTDLAHKESMEKVYIALRLLPDFCQTNFKAIQSQSLELMNKLYLLENTFRIKDFNNQITECLINVLACDLKAVAEFVQKTEKTCSIRKKLQVVQVVNELTDRLLNKDSLPTPFNSQPSNPRTKPKQQKQIGRVVRRSVALDRKPVGPSRARPNAALYILKPFLAQLSRMQLDDKTDPLMATGILEFLRNCIEWKVDGLEMCIDEIFLIVRQLGQVPDWSTRIHSVRLYFTLTLHVVKTEATAEYRGHLQEASDYVDNLASDSIAQSDGKVQDMLLDLRQLLHRLSGNGVVE